MSHESSRGMSRRNTETCKFLRGSPESFFASRKNSLSFSRCNNAKWKKPDIGDTAEPACTYEVFLLRWFFLLVSQIFFSSFREITVHGWYCGAISPNMTQYHSKIKYLIRIE